MQSLKQDLLTWEMHEEPEGWQQQQFQAWKRDAKVRLQFPDFYRYLEERRRHEVEQQKKRAALGSGAMNTSRAPQANYLTTVKEAAMNTVEPTQEQREAMRVIQILKNSADTGAGVPSEIQALTTTHPDWHLWVEASPAIKTACENDFIRFVSVKERGMLPNLEASLARDIAKQLHKVAIERERRELAQSIKEAPQDDPQRWEAVARRIAKHPHYPALNPKLASTT